MVSIQAQASYGQQDGPSVSYPASDQAPTQQQHLLPQQPQASRESLVKATNIVPCLPPSKGPVSVSVPVPSEQGMCLPSLTCPSLLKPPCYPVAPTGSALPLDVPSAFQYAQPEMPLDSSTSRPPLAHSRAYNSRSLATPSMRAKDIESRQVVDARLDVANPTPNVGWPQSHRVSATPLVKSTALPTENVSASHTMTGFGPTAHHGPNLKHRSVMEIKESRRAISNPSSEELVKSDGEARRTAQAEVTHQGQYNVPKAAPESSGKSRDFASLLHRKLSNLIGPSSQPDPSQPPNSAPLPTQATFNSTSAPSRSFFSGGMFSSASQQAKAHRSRSNTTPQVKNSEAQQPATQTSAPERRSDRHASQSDKLDTSGQPAFDADNVNVDGGKSNRPAPQTAVPPSLRPSVSQLPQLAIPPSVRPPVAQLPPSTAVPPSVRPPIAQLPQSTILPSGRLSVSQPPQTTVPPSVRPSVAQLPQFAIPPSVRPPISQLPAIDVEGANRHTHNHRTAPTSGSSSAQKSSGRSSDNPSSSQARLPNSASAASSSAYRPSASTGHKHSHSVPSAMPSTSTGIAESSSRSRQHRSMQPSPPSPKKAPHIPLASRSRESVYEIHEGDETILMTPSSLAPTPLQEDPPRNKFTRSVEQLNEPNVQMTPAERRSARQKHTQWRLKEIARQNGDRSRQQGFFIDPNEVQQDVPASDPHMFTPFRYLATRKKRTMSLLSQEAQDGTAVRAPTLVRPSMNVLICQQPNTAFGSPTASILSTAPFPLPDERDPLRAAEEWRDLEEVGAHQYQKENKRRPRPGVVFVVKDDPNEENKPRPRRISAGGSNARSGSSSSLTKQAASGSR